MGLIMQPSIGIFMSWGGDRYKVMVLQKLSFFLELFLAEKEKEELLKGITINMMMHHHHHSVPSSS